MKSTSWCNFVGAIWCKKLLKINFRWLVKENTKLKQTIVLTLRQSFHEWLIFSLCSLEKFSMEGLLRCRHQTYSIRNCKQTKSRRKSLRWHWMEFSNGRNIRLQSTWFECPPQRWIYDEWFKGRKSWTYVGYLESGFSALCWTLRRRIFKQNLILRNKLELCWLWLSNFLSYSFFIIPFYRWLFMILLSRIS